MRQTIEARTLDSGLIEPAHEVEVVCAACGYDLDEAELVADTCSDCGAPLNLKQHISIHATSVPAAGGGVM
jgi:predicted amidophosphoribosyltransferase